MPLAEDSSKTFTVYHSGAAHSLSKLVFFNACTTSHDKSALLCMETFEVEMLKSNFLDNRLSKRKKPIFIRLSFLSLHYTAAIVI